MIQNCHWGSKYPFKPDRTKPAAEGCPWNFYRTSGDVRASYASIMHNLGTVTPLAAQNLSYASRAVQLDPRWGASSISFGSPHVIVRCTPMGVHRTCGAWPPNEIKKIPTR